MLLQLHDSGVTGKDTELLIVYSLMIIVNKLFTVVSLLFRTCVCVCVCVNPYAYVQEQN